MIYEALHPAMAQSGLLGAVVKAQPGSLERNAVHTIAEFMYNFFSKNISIRYKVNTASNYYLDKWLPTYEC